MCIWPRWKHLFQQRICQNRGHHRVPFSYIYIYIYIYIHIYIYTFITRICTLGYVLTRSYTHRVYNCAQLVSAPNTVRCSNRYMSVNNGYRLCTITHRLPNGVRTNMYLFNRSAIVLIARLTCQHSWSASMPLSQCLSDHASLSDHACLSVRSLSLSLSLSLSFSIALSLTLSFSHSLTLSLSPYLATSHISLSSYVVRCTYTNIYPHLRVAVSIQQVWTYTPRTLCTRVSIIA